MIALIKVALVAGSSHIVRLFVQLILLKLIALKAGPAGLGFWGNYISLVSIAGSLAGGGILSGVIKYVAEFKHDAKRCAIFTTSALVYSLVFSLCIAIVGVIYSRAFSMFIFGSERYTHWIYYFLILQGMVAINNLAYGVLNGKKKASHYALCIITGNSIALIFAVWSIQQNDGSGILLAIIAPIIAPIVPVMWILLRSQWFGAPSFSALKKDTKLLLRFSLMLAFSTVCFPVVEIIIRNQMIASLSLDAVGYWQAITRMSAALLSFFSLFLMIYFIPLVSAETNKAAIVKSSYQCMALLAAAMIVVSLLIGYFGTTIILALYSEPFAVIKPWLQIQLIGDTFRVMAWVIGFLIVAKAKTSWYIGSELFQGGIFIALASLQLYVSPSVVSIVDAYVVTCILYFVVLLSVFVYWAHGKSSVNRVSQ